MKTLGKNEEKRTKREKELRAKVEKIYPPFYQSWKKGLGDEGCKTAIHPRKPWLWALSRYTLLCLKAMKPKA
jgi:hypothetical protein